MALEVTVHALDGERLEFDHDTFDFISLINHGTFGKPAIIAPGDDHVRGAVRVLYINTGGVAAVEVNKS